jgi:tetratricopeptide (TPR) repeat protein
LSKLSVHQRKARDFIQREDWGNAVVELERMLGADAQNPTLHNQIGDVYLRKDEVGRACEHFEQAIDLYATVGLHNNAVALCKKIQRLRPGRIEVRYRLAKLRLEQGFRSDAAASFREYLEHVGQSGAGGEELEQRCREIVELMPDDAPIGLVLEKLEGAQRFVAAFEIVRTLAQRAADAGDDAAAKRYGEKMRSLRVLVERSGGRDLLAEPRAAHRGGGVAAASPGAAVEPVSRAHFEPRVLDLAPSARTAPAAEIVPPRASEPPPAPLLVNAPPAAPPLPAEPPAAPPLAAPPLAPPHARAAPPAPALEVETPIVDAGPMAASPAGGAAETAGDLALPFIGGGFDAFAAAAPSDVDAVEESVGADADASLARPAFDATARAAASTLGSTFDPLAFDEVGAPADDGDNGSHFADLAAALGGVSGDAPDERPVHAGSTATPVAGWPAFDGQAPEPYAPAPAEPPQFASPGVGAAESAPPRTSTDFAPPQYTAPASSSGWVDELRRAPVWIPSGDVISGPDPSRPDRGLSMELESVIDSFREQMTRALDGDGQARYDLGVAYYDMGLYNEALAEFEAAAGSVGLEVRSYEMLAQCLLQTGRHAEVVELLLPVVAADGHAFRGALGLHYCLGLAYEAIGDFDQARHCYEEVALVDVDFKDVQSRLQRT